MLLSYHTEHSAYLKIQTDLDEKLALIDLDCETIDILSANVTLLSCCLKSSDL